MASTVFVHRGRSWEINETPGTAATIPRHNSRESFSKTDYVVKKTNDFQRVPECPFRRETGYNAFHYSSVKNGGQKNRRREEEQKWRVIHRWGEEKFRFTSRLGTQAIGPRFTAGGNGTVATMNNKSARGQTNCNTKLRSRARSWTCAQFHTFISPVSVIYMHHRSSV